MEEDWGELDDIEVIGAAGGSAADARQAGDDAVEGLDKITAQMSGGEHRPEQQEMCRAVAEALATGTHLVVQAGTGTGKSLAYLVPAALSGKKVVVATATKALQDQLANKDLPLVESGLGLPVPLDFAVLKGRSNYICRQRVAEVGSSGIQAELGDQTAGRADEPDWEAPEPGAAPAERAGSAPEGMVEEVRELVTWSQTTRTGDRADLSFEPSDRAWNMLSVGPSECPGAFNCPSGGSCFAEAARDRAAGADIVVVNTHLYGAHLASGGVVLPEHDVVVFDEAHELEEVMTSSLGVELTPGRFRTLVTAARPLVEARDADHLDSLAAAGDLLGTLLSDRVGTRVLHEGTRSPDDEDLSDLLARASEVSRRVVDALRRSGAQRSFVSGDADDPDKASRKTRTLQAAAHLAEDLHRLVGRTDDEVGVGRRHAAQHAPAALPHRRGAHPGGRALGHDHRGADERHDPATRRRAGRPRGLPDRGAQRRQPLRLPVPRAPLRGPPPAGPARRGRGGRGLRGARPVDRGRRRSHAGAVHQPARHRGGGPGARARAALHALARRATSPRADCSRSSPKTRRRASSPRWASGRASTSPAPHSRSSRSTGSPSHGPTTRCSKPGATGPAGAPSRSSTCPAPRRCWRRAPGRLIRTADDKGVVAVLDPRLATASYRGVLLATLPPMRRSVDRSEVDSFLRRALDDEDDGAVAPAAASPTAAQ